MFLHAKVVPKSHVPFCNVFLFFYIYNDPAQETTLFSWPEKNENAVAAAFGRAMNDETASACADAVFPSPSGGRRNRDQNLQVALIMPLTPSRSPTYPRSLPSRLHGE